jgi:hypothetical protein
MKLGYYLPFVLVGNILACIGYGCLSMLTPDYSIANRVGFQILVGLGLGCSLQVVRFIDYPIFIVFD